MIYFDNAATTLRKPDAVPEAITRALASFGGVGRGVHEGAIAAGMAVYHTREQLATLFGAPSARAVAFTHNATEALNIAISGLLRPEDHAITTAASHNSILRPLYRKREQGSQISILPVMPDASIDHDQYAGLFTKSTRLVVVTHASNLTGDIYDIATMAQIAHEHGAIFVLDVAQTAGLIPIDMKRDQIDVVAFTGHKTLFGPQGTGGLCVSEGIKIPPYNVGGAGMHSFDTDHPQMMPESLEAGTLNSHGIAGLSAGLSYIEEEGAEALHQRTQALTDRFEAGVAALDRIILYGGHVSPDRCGIVALNIGDQDSAIVSDHLNAEHQIATRSGAHCAPLMHEALGTAEQGIVRFSFSPFNTEDEVDQGIQTIAALCDRLGSGRSW